MNRREVAITLIGVVRDDGSVYVSSSDAPLFHVVAPSEDKWVEWAIPILTEYLDLNLGGTWKLRQVSSPELVVSPMPVPPAHIIAETRV